MQPVLDVFESIKEKFIAFLDKNPVLKTWFNFAKCFLEHEGTKQIKGLYERLKSFVTTIAALGNALGWVKLLVNLVCAWEDLRDGIAFLKLGFKEAKKPAKYNFFGRFVGKLVKAIAG